MTDFQSEYRIVYGKTTGELQSKVAEFTKRDLKPSGSILFISKDEVGSGQAGFYQPMFLNSDDLKPKLGKPKLA